MELSIEESHVDDNSGFGLVDTSNDNNEKENDFIEDNNCINRNQSIEKSIADSRSTQQIENNSEDLNTTTMEPEDKNGQSLLFKCEFEYEVGKKCDKTFTAEKNLKRHIYTVHEGHRDFQCEICLINYTSKQVLLRHMNMMHNIESPSKDDNKIQFENDSEDHGINDSTETENDGNKSFKCDRCDKMFTANRNLKRHIYIVHEGHKDFQCAVCYQFFGFKQILERHMEKMHNIETSKNDTNIQFENDPEEDFSAENEIDYDLMDNSNEVIETLDDFTEKSFKNEAMDMLEENPIKIEFIDENTQMDDQISLSPPPPKTNYDVEIYHNIEFKKSKKSWQYGSSHDCEHCGKSFPQSGTLRRHINDVHEGIRNYKCHLCDQKFAQKSSLSGHLLTIHKIKPENKTIYKCSHCEKEFEKLSKLQTHEAVHLKPAREPTDIKCEICSKTFSDKANLKKHVQSIHEGLKKYSCDICSEKFKQLIAMQRHKKRYHDIEIERKTYKPRMDLEPRLDCPTCGKVFKRFSIVKMHIKNYHSQEIHQCNICEEKFLLKEDLQSHYQMVHEGIEPPPDYRSHNCDICGRPFADYSNYRRHVSNSYCNDSKNMVKL